MEVPPDMRVTSKGQVTIPQAIRDKYGILPYSEVEFVEEDGCVILRKQDRRRNMRERLGRLRGSATHRMTTEEIMELTRGEE